MSCHIETRFYFLLSSPFDLNMKRVGFMDCLITFHYSLLLVLDTALNSTSPVYPVAVAKPQTFQLIGLEWSSCMGRSTPRHMRSVAFPMIA